MTQSNRFISEFCKWAGERGLPKNRRARLSTALQKAVEQKLPERDSHNDIIIRPLVDSEGLTCTFDSQEVWLYRNNEKQLICGVVAPSWGSGWRNISKDEYVEEMISAFFHFASQYVARSRMTNLTGAIALTYERACDFRYGGLQRYTVGSKTHFPTIESAKIMAAHIEGYVPAANQSADDSRKQREFATWVLSINALDPYIQRVIYQYWRATALFKANFLEEVLTALDGITSVAAQFVQDRLGASSNPRQSLASFLKLSSSDSQQLVRLYELRCDFGAHPSRSKWWDFAELYDEDLDAFKDSAKRMLWRLCKTESKNRVVETYTKRWSEWFTKNAHIILDSVWFLHIR
jgi:hypothetical protein